jgi:hypothetical protein
MAAFLVRALGLTERLDNPFIDDDHSIFESDIEKLAKAGITKGCNPPDNDRFCPDSKITREQMAALLVRALGYTDDGGGNLFIDDDDSIFEQDIDRLARAGVTKGCNPPDNSRLGSSILGGEGDHDLIEELRSILFPGITNWARARPQHVRDVKHMHTAIRYGADAFVTLDDNFHAKADQLDAHIKVWTPRKAASVVIARLRPHTT